MSVDTDTSLELPPVPVEGDETPSQEHYEHVPNSPLLKEQLLEYCTKFNLVPEGYNATKMNYQTLWRKFIHHRYNINTTNTTICWYCLQVIGDKEHPPTYCLKDLDTKLFIEKDFCESCYQKQKDSQ